MRKDMRYVSHSIKSDQNYCLNEIIDAESTQSAYHLAQSSPLPLTASANSNWQQHTGPTSVQTNAYYRLTVRFIRPPTLIMGAKLNIRYESLYDILNIRHVINDLMCSFSISVQVTLKSQCSLIRLCLRHKLTNFSVGRIALVVIYLGALKNNGHKQY